MAKQVSIDDVSLNKLMREMDSSSAQMRQHFKDLTNMINQLEANWKGIAANTFRQQQTSLNNDQEAVRRLLDSVREAVGKTKTDHNTNEDEVNAAMRGVGASSGDPSGGPGSKISGL